MSNKLAAFKEPIKEGLIRILLRITAVECEVENDAPDFVDAKYDKPKLLIIPESDLTGLTKVFEESYKLTLNERKSKGNVMVWEPEKGGVWFDIEMDAVKDIWLSDFNFFIESEKPRYLAYYIKDVEHNVEWLQTDIKTGEIRSLSNFKKKFSPSSVSENEKYSGTEILKCADMLKRAISKIDMRTHNALVKFNVDKGRLEPLLIGMGERLGYTIRALDKETIYNQSEKGNSVSHSISLK